MADPKSTGLRGAVAACLVVGLLQLNRDRSSLRERCTPELAERFAVDVQLTRPAECVALDELELERQALALQGEPETLPAWLYLFWARAELNARELRAVWGFHG